MISLCCPSLCRPCVPESVHSVQYIKVWNMYNSQRNCRYDISNVELVFPTLETVSLRVSMKQMCNATCMRG